MEKKIDFLGVRDKALNVYSKFSPEEFWDFINPKEEFFYELRIKTPRANEKAFPYIKELAKLIKVPYHWTGVFIASKISYRKAISYCLKNKLTLYLSANPKRESFHSKDNLNFKTYNGEMQSDLCYYSLLLDFDATKKAKKELLDTTDPCYQVAKNFLAKNTNIKKYCMLSTGNGIQLRIPLDEIIYLPKDTYDQNNKFIITKEFEVYQKILKESMKGILADYSTPLVNIDYSSLEIARVGRSPFSINWKNELSPKYSGIIEIVELGENLGLTKFILSFYDKISLVEEKKELYKDYKIAKEFSYTKETLKKCALVRLMTDNELPGGGRNNILFFQFKLLCKNNGIDLRCEEVKEIVRNMEHVQNEKYPLNDCSGTFHPEAIINYCIEHRIEPIYPVLYFIEKPQRNIKNILELYEALLDNETIDEKLPAERNLTKRIILWVRNHFLYHNQGLINLSIRRLMLVIKNTYDKETLEYLVNYDILKTILDKT